MSGPTNAAPRVLHVITHLALGGAERIALNLAHGLRSNFAPGIFAVNGIASDEIGAACQEELAQQKTPLFCGPRIRVKHGGLIPCAIAAARAVRDFRPHLLHVHTEIPEATIATMFALQPSSRQIPVVRTIHNAVYWGSWPRLGRWCDRQLADAHIAGVSRAALEAFHQLRAASSARAPAEPPMVIHNAVHVPAPAVESSPPTRRPDMVRVLFAGRFETQKGADLIPAILSRVRLPAGQTGELTLYGDGSEAPTLRALALSPPSGWRVHVAAPRPNLTASLHEFDLVLMPSRFEGLSVFAIEALLAGVPMVAAAAPGLREQLPADHPWLGEPGDAVDLARVLQAALNHRDLWRSVAARSREFARTHFDPETMFAAYAELYRRSLPRT
jgi:glycosyltransferase involved in cell wall biosynthesis